MVVFLPLVDSLKEGGAHKTQVCTQTPGLRSKFENYEQSQSARKLVQDRWALW